MFLIPNLITHLPEGRCYGKVGKKRKYSKMVCSGKSGLWLRGIVKHFFKFHRAFIPQRRMKPPGIIPALMSVKGINNLLLFFYFLFSSIFKVLNLTLFYFAREIFFILSGELFKIRKARDFLFTPSSI